MIVLDLDDLGFRLLAVIYNHTVPARFNIINAFDRLHAASRRF